MNQGDTYGGTPRGASSVGLVVEGLWAGYGRMMAIRDVSFDVAPGEVVAVLGANGAGKTTLARALTGFLPVSKGDVRLDGLSIAGTSPDSLARQGVRLVQDGHRVFPTLTVAQNLHLGLSRGRSKTERHDAIAEILEAFPALKWATGKFARVLSGGQQQMLALAQALVSHPRMLVCDEPSVGLSPVVLPDVFLALRQAVTAYGCAALVMEQQVDLALEHSDRTVVLAMGTVQAEVQSSVLRDDQESVDRYFGIRVGY